MLRMVLAAVLMFPVLSFAQGGQVFRFNDKNARDTVSFSLHAPFERINGLSNTITGEVRVEKDKVSGAFRVPVNSIKTGNSLRDEHLQNDRWLDAEKHPDILFTFNDVKLPSELKPGQEVKLTAEGEFTIHGIKRKEQVEVTGTWFKESEETKFRAPGDLLHLTASFKIPIEQYGIKRTQALLLKVGDTANVSVDAWGSTRFELPKATVSQTAQP